MKALETNIEVLKLSNRQTPDFKIVLSGAGMVRELESPTEVANILEQVFNSKLNGLKSDFKLL